MLRKSALDCANASKKLDNARLNLIICELQEIQKKYPVQGATSRWIDSAVRNLDGAMCSIKVANKE